MTGRRNRWLILAALLLAAATPGRAQQLQIEAAATLAGAPAAEAANLEAAVRTAEGRFVLVSVPRQAVTDLDALHRRFDGKARAEMVEQAAALSGQAADVLELDETDDAPEFADCSAWQASTHPVTGAEMLVAAPWRIDGRRPGLRKPAPLLGEGDDDILRRVLRLGDDEIDALIAAGAVGIKALQ